MTGVRRKTGGCWVALALLALTLKVMVPPGFMVAPAGGGLPLVICTGHGPMELVGGRDGGSHKAPKPGDAPCAFAGHALTPPLAAAPNLVVASASPVLAVSVRPADLLPGRGLAAPPPPSQAPPTFV